MPAKKECIIPKFILVGPAASGHYGLRVLAANNVLERLRENKHRSGWDDEPNIRIYQLKE
jgi:hypothetical protein